MVIGRVEETGALPVTAPALSSSADHLQDTHTYTTMAGHFGRHLLHPDKEVEKFSDFRENLIRHYKWNLKSAGFAILFLAAIPVGLSYVGYKYQAVNRVASRREEPIYEKHNNWIPRS